MQPEIDLLGIPLKTFGLSLAAAFLCSGLLVGRRLRELDKPGDWAYEFLLAAVIGGIVGARGYYLIQHLGEVRDDPLGSLISGAGLVFYGGLIGGAIAVWAWARHRGFGGVALLDLGAPAVAIGYAVGRIGCQLSGDGDYGSPSDLPWAMAYPDGAVPIDVTVHPTPIYETVVMGLVTWVLWRQRGRLRPGLLMAGYLVSAGLERFLVEFIRRNDEVLAGLTAPQLESIGIFVVGVAWFAVTRRRGGWRHGATGAPPEVAGRAAAATA